jgi:hypothetical protein
MSDSHYPEDDTSPSANFDVDSARKRLESFMGDNNNNDDDSSSPSTKEEQSSDEFSLQDLFASKQLKLPPPPTLSTIERDRRVAEIELLQQLAHSDEATSDLWELWYSERGATAQLLLKEADRLTEDPNSWSDVETILVGLIDTYGIYFAEPVNRLATLYFLQGRLEESYKLCQVILKIKPWHFGALSGIVQVCICMGDRNAARVWAEKRLPTIVADSSFPPFAMEGPENPRREQWVDRAVANAKELLQKAERHTKKSFGKPEQYYRRSDDRNTNQILDQDQDGGAWQ